MLKYCIINKTTTSKGGIDAIEPTITVGIGNVKGFFLLRF